MDDKKQRIEQLKQNLQDGLARLENVNLDDLSDDDLESVAGGAEAAADCSTWCCSDAPSPAADVAA